MRSERKPHYPLPEPPLKFATDLLVGMGAVVTILGVGRGLAEEDIERIIASSICSGLVLAGSLGLELNRSRRRKLML